MISDSVFLWISLRVCECASMYVSFLCLFFVSFPLVVRLLHPILIYFVFSYLTTIPLFVF